MKKIMLSMLVLLLCYYTSFSQSAGNELQNAVIRLDKASSVADYEALEREFSGIAARKADWLPYYYAAYCNAKIGFLYRDSGERIEPYSKRGEEQALKARSLLDTVTQQRELSELYTVISMVYRTRIFISPMRYGRKFGMLSGQYLQKAKELNPQNPRAMYVEALIKYYTPGMWGGDKNLAKQLASESLAKLQHVTAGTAPHWGKAENLELLSHYK
ncbi:hypothetical protein [Chitinophaga ginsengisoli]|uniref:Uncharacterized protein n=1 Tax=Chitinophaga ginsengisoli TaxID=363837 RepID=A0A2P8FVR2_9BACT|nr:hypothetical protein [Chitinophaga ginsengisoli]PSL25812.1 hypothetical protein CLV42_11217 [Chitinophaga ginsengisoli]